MATITFKKGDEYALKLSKLVQQSESISGKAIHDAAGIVADKIKTNLKENIYDPAYVGKGSGGLWGAKTSLPTGDLEGSFGISPLERDKNGFLNVKIGFDGYDSKGVPNMLKARAMESGTPRLRARPFVRPAVAATKKQALGRMKKVIDEEIEKLVK